MKVKAVLRRGQFCNWITLHRFMDEVAVPMPDDVKVSTEPYGHPAEVRHEVWYFRFNQYLAEDMVEYLFDRIERR